MHSLRVVSCISIMKVEALVSMSSAVPMPLGVAKVANHGFKSVDSNGNHVPLIKRTDSSKDFSVCMMVCPVPSCSYIVQIHARVQDHIDTQSPKCTRKFKNPTQTPLPTRPSSNLPEDLHGTKLGGHKATAVREDNVHGHCFQNSRFT